MSITLKAFREITNGFARGHHFNIGILDWRDPKITSPIAQKVVGTAATPLLSAFCSATTLPSRTFSDHNLTIQDGIPPFKVANDISYNPWVVTFYSDELLALRYFFLRWQEIISNNDPKLRGYPSQYKSKLAYAAVLTPQDIPCHVYTFRGLYPSIVDDLQLAQDQTEILKFIVTFSYDYFELNELTGYGIALAHEVVGDRLLSGLVGERSVNKERSINAPLGISVNIPF